MGDVRKKVANTLYPDKNIPTGFTEDGNRYTGKFNLGKPSPFRLKKTDLEMELPLVPGASDLVILAHHHLQVDILYCAMKYMTFLTEKDRKLNFVTFCRRV